VAHWRRRAHAEAGDGTPPDPKETRSFRVGVASDGYAVGSFVFDPEAAATLHQALDKAMGPPTPDDKRSTARRRADAVIEIFDAYLKGDLAGGRGAAHLSVLVSVDDLLHHIDQHDESSDHSPRPRRPGPGPRLVDGTPVDPQWLGRLACNSFLRRVIIDADGLPLDVGREHRFATPAIWHALVVRDGGCSHPWCDRRPAGAKRTTSPTTGTTPTPAPPSTT